MENFKLQKDFFQRQDTHQIAKDLLGKVLIRRHKNGRIQAGIIVETESYHGFDDRASHAARARTKRTEVIFGEGGHYYVYFIYGIYWNLNIVAGEKEFPSAILIRALEPIYDSELDLSKISFQEKFKLASGPGKLCRWMGIDREFYGKSVEDEELFIIDSLSFRPSSNCHPEELKWLVERREDLNLSTSLEMTKKKLKPINIIETKRIGVDYAGEWAHKDWRYYIKDNPFVSKK